MATEDDLYDAWKVAGGSERQALEGAIFEEVALHAKKLMAKMKLFPPDLPSEAASDVLKGLTGFKQESKFSTWSEEIVRNHIRDHIKKLRDERRNREDIDDHPDAKSAGEEELISRIDRERLLRELTPDQMKVFELYLEGFKQYEIAAFLELPTDNVESKLRAIREIAKKSNFGSGK